ncbi:DUF6714 family protein, partial [Roseibacillus ishigakijimensis]
FFAVPHHQNYRLTPGPIFGVHLNWRMRRASESDIVEMRSLGYDSVTIEEAKRDLERSKVADEIIRSIEVAFAGVTLGEGVGLREAQGLDDYEDEATCAQYREGDEKEDWSAITSDQLNACNSSLSFFDAEGMRFHLPAYLISDLRGEYNFEVDFSLTYLTQQCREQYSLFSREQRAVVRTYLLFLREDPEYGFERPSIERALRVFWTSG